MIDSKKTRRYKNNPRLCCLICFLGVVLLLPAAAPAADDPVLNPSLDQSKTLEGVMSRLEQSHYRKLSIDDNLSIDLFDRYLEYLDPSRIYLLALDVSEFEKYRLTLDDALRRGDLEPAFEIFNRFQKRRFNRMEYLNKAIVDDFESLRFDVDEALQLDRENVPWVRDLDEWNDLWRKQFKNDVLNLKLADRSMEEIKEILEPRYRDRLMRMKQINSEDIFRVYINAFTRCYDPHTEYFPPRRAENFDIEMSLSYEGIGALLGTDGEYIKISQIIPGGPAEKDGKLGAGDRIVAVGQGTEDVMVDVIGWRVDEAVTLIRGPRDTVVRLAVIPANQPDTGSTRTIQLTRNEVKLEEQAAKSKIVEVERDGAKMKIGIIELPAFYIDFEGARNDDPNYKSSTRDVAMLVEKLKDEDVDGIVVDLRANGGGSLGEAADLCGLFIGPGPVVQVKNSRNRVQVLNNPDARAIYNGPLAVLVNRISASASEIFAGAVIDYGRGIVVGGRTFGKGTVQSLAPLEDGQLKMTYAKFYRISGGSTQNRGVVPDISFPAVYDQEEIGESALEEALPWDTIRPVEHRKSDTIFNILPMLRRAHEKRILKDPDFVFLTDRLSYLTEARKNTIVSLNEAVRRQERESMEAHLLSFENKRRVAKGLDPVEKFEDLEKSEDSENPEDSEPTEDEDPYAKEAANILFDLKRILNGK